MYSHIQSRSQTQAAATIDSPPEVINAPPQMGQQEEQTPKKPPMFAVILHNDRSTNFLFVLEVLNDVFQIQNPRAQQIMMAAHLEGQAVVAIYSEDVALTRVAQAQAKIQADGVGQNGINPQAPCELTFTAEPESDDE